MRHFAGPVILSSAAIVAAGTLAATITAARPWGLPGNPPATAPEKEGLWSPLMKRVVAKLTVGDMVAIAAYAVWRTP